MIKITYYPESKETAVAIGVKKAVSLGIGKIMLSESEWEDVVKTRNNLIADAHMSFIHFEEISAIIKEDWELGNDNRPKQK